MERDKLSGAAEIGSDLATQFLDALRDDALYETCRDVLATYPSMASLWTMANLAFLRGQAAASEYEAMKTAGSEVVHHGVWVLEPNITVLTYSRSSTILRILQASGTRISSVICGEGRPNYEGRRLALELAGADIDVRFTTDASALSLVGAADLVLLGADALLADSIVNKTGSQALGLAARHHGVPLYVAASSYKRFPFILVKQEDPDEVWADVPSNIHINNVYFEGVSADLVSGFVTEHGIQKNIPSFDRPVADEIFQIKDELAGRYRLLE